MRRGGWLTNLRERIDQLERCSISRMFAELEARCQELERQALESGAMPGEFRVRLMFVRNLDSPGARMRPVLL